MDIGFSGYVVILFYFTGSLVLLTDVKAYKNANMKKERKASLILGWLNISLGLLLMLANWIYKNFFW
ncbi:CLC_0170 family protein [Neobacillus sp. K501]